MTLQHVPWGSSPEFEWDEHNEQKIFRDHRVSWLEIEECFENERWVALHNKARSDPERYGDLYRVRGITHGGRKLFIIVQYLGDNVVRAVTAFDDQRRAR